MIALIVNDIEYTNFESINVSSAIDTLSGTFSFVAFTESVDEFPFTVNDRCRVEVNGTPIITGFIEKLAVNYGATQHTITLSGRSKTADVIDSTLGDGVDFDAAISLKQLIEDVLKLAGISGIGVIDAVGDIEPFTVSEKESAEVGITAFDLIERYCRKRHVLITDNGDGDIVITRGEGGNPDDTFSLINTFDTSDINNVLSASVSFDNSNKFIKYIATSSANPTTSNILGRTSGAPANADIVEVSGFATDTSAREGRTLNIIAESASSKQQCIDRAFWQASINSARSFRYSVTVQGFTNGPNGPVWQTNRIVSVRDVFAGLDGDFLIDSVSFSTSAQSGSTTQLEIVKDGVYNITLREPVRRQQDKKKKRKILGPINL